jgi:hypothetical protein
MDNFNAEADAADAAKAANLNATQTEVAKPPLESENKNEWWPRGRNHNGGKRKTHGTKKTASRKRVNKKRASNKKRSTQKRK